MYYRARHHCITEFCHDFTGTKYGGHDVYLYVWLDENNKPFYVGSGRGNRATSVSRRNEQFKSRLNKYCGIAFIAEGLHRLGGYSLEIFLTDKLSKMGFNLDNVAYNTGRDKQYKWIPDDIMEPCCSDFLEWVVGQHEPILK